jgi:hypothetical protein
MARESERLEREADQTRALLSASLAELRARMTPGQLVDRVVDYAREGPTTEFFANLRREIRENPLPVVLIGVGIAWLMLASSRSARTIVADTTEFVARTVEGGADRVADVTGRVARRVHERTRTLADRVSPSTDPSRDGKAAPIEERQVTAACAVAGGEAGEGRGGPAPIAAEAPAARSATSWEPVHDRR